MQIYLPVFVDGFGQHKDANLSSLVYTTGIVESHL